jgi:hypothetical protein
MSPLALVSAGIAMVRMQRSPDGSVSALGVVCAAGVSVMGKGSSFSLTPNVLRWLDGSHGICKKLQKWQSTGAECRCWNAMLIFDKILPCAAMMS